MDGAREVDLFCSFVQIILSKCWKWLETQIKRTIENIKIKIVALQAFEY